MSTRSDSWVMTGVPLMNVYALSARRFKVPVVTLSNPSIRERAMPNGGSCEMTHLTS
jgi:hypothetical protein